jgi:hypothetical protein
MAEECRSKRDSGIARASQAGMTCGKGNSDTNETFFVGEAFGFYTCNLK